MKNFHNKLKKCNFIKMNNIFVRKLHDYSMDITTLHRAYESGQLLPTQVVERSYQRIRKDKASWTFPLPLNHVMAKAQRLDEDLKKTREQGKDFKDLLAKYPLFGIPFGAKDNLDVAGFPTTAACPAYSRTPWVSNPVIDQCKNAGAILMGKQNMDQFAAGLVGVRSPYGIPG